MQKVSSYIVQNPVLRTDKTLFVGMIQADTYTMHLYMGTTHTHTHSHSFSIYVLIQIKHTHTHGGTDSRENRDEDVAKN